MGRMKLKEALNKNQITKGTSVHFKEGLLVVDLKTARLHALIPKFCVGRDDLSERLRRILAPPRSQTFVYPEDNIIYEGRAYYTSKLRKSDAGLWFDFNYSKVKFQKIRLNKEIYAVEMSVFEEFFTLKENNSK